MAFLVLTTVGHTDTMLACMHTLAPSDIKKQLVHCDLGKARELARTRRVYRLAPRDGGWSACVLDDKGIPASPWLAVSGKRLDTDCDCGQTEGCLHVWALAARLIEQGTPLPPAVLAGFDSLDHPGPLAFLKRRKAPPEPDLFADDPGQAWLFGEPGQAARSKSRPSRPASRPAEPELFAEPPAAPHSRREPSLFDEPAEMPASSEAASLPPPAASAPAAPSVPPVRHLGPSLQAERPQLVIFLLRLQAMNRPELWVEKLCLNLTASQAGAQLAALAACPAELGAAVESQVQALARRVEQSPEHQLSLGSAIADLAELERGLRPLGKLPLPRLAFTTPNRALGLVGFDALLLRPQLLRTTPEGKGRYQLGLELLDEGAALATVPAAALASEGSLVYAMLPGGERLAYRRNDHGLASLVARLRALPSPYTALDLELLRRWMEQQGIANARLGEAGNERFAYRRVQPQAVLSLQAGLHRIEIYLSFAYEGVECAFHAAAEHLTRELPDRMTVVMPRQKTEESRLHHGLRDLLWDCTQYERGLYADLVGGRNVPDISVEGELSAFITERGPGLIAAGYELRLEGRPIKAGGALSFRAESGMDWFGFRAAWKPGGEDAAGEDAPRGLDGQAEETDPWALNGGGGARRSLDLVVDEHLDQYGLAGARGGEAGDSWIILGKRDIDRLKLLRNLGMDQNGLLETSPVNISLIDSLYQDIENKHEAHVERARRLSTNLADFTARQQAASASHAHAAPEGLLPQPQGLTTTLRSYQLVGYNWLAYLHEQGLGGCLADDMGLGKTVQTIALLQRLKENRQLGPSLLIAPVVTLPNWEDEIARFAPGLRCKRHAGADRARTVDELLGKAGIPGSYRSSAQSAGLSPAARNDPAEPGRGAASDESPAPGAGPELEMAAPAILGEAAWDLILVSYQTLRNDLDLFVQQQWDYAILDEAHYIKNAGSQIFKAIRVLPAAHRLSLTGTPIENSTMELWAQFSFLNPGLLGSRRHFMSEVAAPIEKGGDEAALAALRDTIAPFILRRRKQDVLADLPPKDEILNWCEMGADQARLYEETSAYYRDQIAGALDQKGVEGSRMDIFRALLRLRQIAINPAMIRHAPRDGYGEPDEDQSGSSPYAHVSSAKMESLRMLMDESLQEDHKMLVFSQFVSALKLISGDLDKDGRRHALLTGQTADRRAVVKDFQTDEELKIFLLSLKAGGVGINLTAADYVVLFDPWWNPAAERQAVDRAHRMGQKRPVIVYKFITRGTIEEKILALQHKKHKLVGSLLVGDSGEEGLLSGMDENAVMDLFK